MNWALYAVLMAVYLWMPFVAGRRPWTASWHWAILVLCIIQAGWTFIMLDSAVESVIWILAAGYWAYLLHRRIRSLQPW